MKHGLKKPTVRFSGKVMVRHTVQYHNREHLPAMKVVCETDSEEDDLSSESEGEDMDWQWQEERQGGPPLIDLTNTLPSRKLGFLNKWNLGNSTSFIIRKICCRWDFFVLWYEQKSQVHIQSLEALQYICWTCTYHAMESWEQFILYLHFNKQALSHVEPVLCCTRMCSRRFSPLIPLRKAPQIIHTYAGNMSLITKLFIPPLPHVYVLLKLPHRVTLCGRLPIIFKRSCAANWIPAK